MPNPSIHTAVIKDVVLPDGTRCAAVLAMTRSGEAPAAKTWNRLCERNPDIVRKFQNRLNTILQSGHASLSSEMMRDLGAGVLEVKIKHPRWRAIAFKVGKDIHIAEFLLHPSNSEITKAKQRADTIRPECLPYEPI